MTGMTGLCGARCWWWDLDTTGHCINPASHGGDHYDGLRYFDSYQLQVDGTSHQYTPVDTRGAHAGTPHLDDDTIQHIRARYDNGASLAAIAADTGLSYGVVSRCALRRTYRKVS